MRPQQTHTMPSQEVYNCRVSVVIAHLGAALVRVEVEAARQHGRMDDEDNRNGSWSHTGRQAARH